MRGIFAIFMIAVSLVACSRPATQAVASSATETSNAYSHGSTASVSTTTSASPNDPKALRTLKNSSQTNNANSWDSAAAAKYLDQREVWWTEWQGAARDHETFCVSCHTAVPYALSRPALRKVSGQDVRSAPELKLVQNVAKRVRLWKQVEPFYCDKEYGTGKTAESRGTESVLNALILANYDAESGHLSPDTRAAFENMWALQETTGTKKRGAWSWLQFGLAPWEANDSQYYGATLAAVAVGLAPENYRDTPEIQGNLKVLSEYLQRQLSSQSTLNRLFLLWASTKLPGLLNSAQQKSIVNEVLSKQQKDDGWNLPALAGTWRGWSLSAFLRTWKREDGTGQEILSDGFATGLTVFVLEEARIPRDNEQLKRGRSWLMRNQNEQEGLWRTSSLNKNRLPSSNIGHFMSDAATAYAVLALTEDQGAAEAISAADR